MALPFRALWVITLVKFLGTPNNEGFLKTKQMLEGKKKQPKDILSF
jgi:hypothetical protein